MASIKRILHSGSALAFQARGAGSIPAIRSSKKLFTQLMNCFQNFSWILKIKSTF